MNAMTTQEKDLMDEIDEVVACCYWLISHGRMSVTKAITKVIKENDLFLDETAMTTVKRLLEEMEEKLLSEEEIS